MTIDAAQHRTPAPLPPLRVPPRALRDGIAAGAALVVLLWAVQVEPSARLDALFATGAHLSGLLAGYGVLVLLLLMARVPAIEHGSAPTGSPGGTRAAGGTSCGCASATPCRPVRIRRPRRHRSAPRDRALLGYAGIAAATAGTSCSSCRG